MTAHVQGVRSKRCPRRDLKRVEPVGISRRVVEPHTGHVVAGIDGSVDRTHRDRYGVVVEQNVSVGKGVARVPVGTGAPLVVRPGADPIDGARVR